MNKQKFESMKKIVHRQGSEDTLPDIGAERPSAPLPVPLAIVDRGRTTVLRSLLQMTLRIPSR